MHSTRFRRFIRTCFVVAILVTTLIVPASADAQETTSKPGAIQNSVPKIAVPVHSEKSAPVDALNTGNARNSGWRYIPDNPTDSFPGPLPVSIPLSAVRPALVEQEVPQPEGAKRTYGLFRFGSAQSIQIAVMMDDFGAGRFNLYVNSDRDSEITSDELIAGTGSSRTIKLFCEVNYAEPIATSKLESPKATVSGAKPSAATAARVESGSVNSVPIESGDKSEQTRTKRVDRVIVLKRSLVGKSLTMMTQGYLEGKIKLANHDVPARRTDGDGNGMFSDPKDRLWVDLNGDGKWDSFQEQFALQPLLTFAGQRYAVKTDRSGDGLSCEPITGEGSMRFAIAGLDSMVQLKEIEITVAGRDGSLFAARAVDEPVTLPVGEYALSMARVVIGLKEDPASTWEFVFSKLDLGENSVWHTIQRDQSLVIDPVGKMSLTFGWDGNGQPVLPGRELYLRPILQTQDGLIINSAKQIVGGASHEIHLSMELCRSDGTIIQNASSGFA
ncbi:MAG: hypothetical protein JWM11_3726 [Planctomycetaceae bacterium]|nr:hypothetical protein [Planctomycetaceae bacterium]